MTTSNRFLSIDIAKGLGIVLMIIGHLKISDTLSTWIHGFHMPLFFFLSGMCFKKGLFPFFTFLKKKVLQLIVPYAFFGIISMIVAHHCNNRDYIISLRNLIFFPNTNPVAINGAIWFLPSFFWATIIFFVMKKLAKNEIACLFISLTFSTLGMFLTSVMSFHIPFGIDTSISCQIFIEAGYILKEKLLTKESRLNKINLFILFIAFAINALLILFNGMVNFRKGQSQIIPLTIFNAVTGCVLIILFTNKIESLLQTCYKNIIGRAIKFIADIGKFSMTFLCLNQLYIWVISQIIKKVGISLPTLQKNLLIFVLVIPALYITMCVFERTPLKVLVGRSLKSTTPAPTLRPQ